MKAKQPRRVRRTVPVDVTVTDPPPQPAPTAAGRPGQILTIRVPALVVAFYSQIGELAAMTTEEAMRVVLAMKVIEAREAVAHVARAAASGVKS